ncbi:LacI family DNA-binding transcriptional regulator [Cellulophaga sp. HaHaR_3_176]|uniref:LacI family DNA-binding transcriptional regulator n=1 Tax=Cellulophaga sp. HaHaR_3_176 TaxID=1942464 RepID=UPI001C1FDDDE|nr:LacI family DNA-binding transcriptional regulator [Cellulophaga sp. HaHaR_3_176]QWX82827.1 LacI family DNA-binding transcriptional regulator [Cellulophaga sp. HaHaR_3_176]
MSKKITLKELAIISKFSVSTISKALSDNNEISTITKKKIKAIARKHNYKPNAMARGLKSKKTKTIGVIIPNILTHYFAKVLSGIEQEVTKSGYNIITCISNESHKKEVKSIELLASGSVDGFLISLSKESQKKNDYSHLNDVIENGLPIVMFDRTSNEVVCDKVIINDFESAYNITEVLIDASCKNIIYISPLGDTNVGTERANGYSKAIEDKFNNSTKPVVLNFTDYSKFSIELEEYLEKNVVDGIVSSNELSGIFAMNLAISKGLKVPDDIAFVAFTDGILSRNSNPPLTIVNQNETELGRLAAATLIKRLEKKSDNQFTTQILNTSIIHRKSSKKNILI